MDKNQLVRLLALQSVERVGNKTVKTLVSYCGSPEAVFGKKAAALQKIPGIGPEQAQKIFQKKDFSIEEARIQKALRGGLQVTTCFDNNYPHRLRQMHDAPVMLFHKGAVDLGNNRMVAVVGTRKPTAYGRKVCRQIIAGLAQYGVFIVSGLAYGIDITAHRAALSAGLPTIGVLAFGHDCMYPGEHAGTARKMMEEGALVSEYPPETRPERENFPQRNRIIAGLSEAVVIVETDLKGGANITANIAHSYDRDVFAVPGSIENSVAQGCHMLIKNHKAALVENAGDIAYQMGWDLMKNTKESNVSTEPLLPKEEKVITLLREYNQMNADTLAFRLKVPAGDMMSLLLSLECKGWVKSLPGNLYTCEK